MQFLDKRNGLETEVAKSRKETNLAHDIVSKIVFQFDKDSVKYRDEVLEYIRGEFKVASSDQRIPDYDFWLWYNGDNDLYYFDLTTNTKQREINEVVALTKSLQEKVQQQFEGANFKVYNIWNTEYDFNAINNYLGNNSNEILLRDISTLKKLIAMRYSVSFYISEMSLKKLDELKEIYLSSLTGKRVSFYGVVGKIIKDADGNFLFRKRRARNYVQIYTEDLVKIEEV